MSTAGRSKEAFASWLAAQALVAGQRDDRAGKRLNTIMVPWECLSVLREVDNAAQVVWILNRLCRWGGAPFLTLGGGG